MGAEHSTSTLADFILNTYKNWRKNREKLDKKRQDNLNAFRGLSEGKWKSGEAEAWRSKSFINATKQKVVTAYAIVIDIMLAGGRIPMMLKPYPDQEPPEKSPEKKTLEEIIQFQERRIQTQFADCKADRSFMKHVLSAALYGDTFAKATIDDRSKVVYRKAIDAPPGVDLSKQMEKYGVYQREIVTTTQPGWSYVSIWDIFWDMESENIRDGAGIMQRAMKSAHWLRGKKGKTYFNDAAIDRVLETAEKRGSTKMADSEDKNTLPPGLREV